MAKYTYYIVTRSADHHYPVLMANNGKQALNEPMRRKSDLSKAIYKMLAAAQNLSEVAVIPITEANFKEKFPRFAKNSGPKQATQKVHKRDPLSKAFDASGSWRPTAGTTKRPKVTLPRVTFPPDPPPYKPSGPRSTKKK